MKTKHYHLSYKWQTAGWILLAVALMVTCLIVGVGLYMTMSEAVTKLFVAAVYVVTAVSLLLIAFSEERQEDEFIKSLRGRSLAAAACVAFVLSIIWFCVSNVGRMYSHLQMGDESRCSSFTSLFSKRVCGSIDGGAAMKNNIRVERAVLRISQQQLAEAVGVSRQTIYAIENGKFIPSTELALKLSAYFGKTVNELFQLD